MRKINLIAAVSVILAAPLVAVAHEGERFSAGEPGDPKQPARVVKVVMREDGKKMLFDPAHVVVRKGEQIRFVLSNDGTENHEFVLATVAENNKHALFRFRSVADGRPGDQN